MVESALRNAYGDPDEAGEPRLGPPPERLAAEDVHAGASPVHSPAGLRRRHAARTLPPRAASMI